MPTRWPTLPRRIFEPLCRRPPLCRLRAPGQRAGDASSNVEKFVVVGAHQHIPDVVSGAGNDGRQLLGAAVAAKHLLGRAMIGRVATLAPGTTKGAFADLNVLVMTSKKGAADDLCSHTGIGSSDGCVGVP